MQYVPIRRHKIENLVAKDHLEKLVKFFLAHKNPADEIVWRSSSSSHTYAEIQLKDRFTEIMGILPYNDYLSELVYIRKKVMFTVSTHHPKFYGSTIDTWEIIMARGNTSSTLQNFEMINLSLTESQAEDFRHWVEEMQKKKFDPINEILGNGYKLSAVMVDSNNSLCVTITGTESSENPRKSMSSWSDNFSEGCWLACYKAFVIFRGKQWENSKQARWG